MTGRKPCRASHQASAGPATLAPEMRMSLPSMAPDYTYVLHVCIVRTYKICARITGVGHREDLLAGAVACLREKGYARTTARDIVAASGTNLGSIGYHYGSTKALLNAAVLAAIGEWGAQLAGAMAAGIDPAAPFPRRFEQYWSAVLATFGDYRQVWAASVD